MPSKNEFKERLPSKNEFKEILPSKNKFKEKLPPKNEYKDKKHSENADTSTFVTMNEWKKCLAYKVYAYSQMLMPLR